jgi:AraC-like DNA-binding protein
MLALFQLLLPGSRGAFRDSSLFVIAVQLLEFSHLCEGSLSTLKCEQSQNRLSTHGLATLNLYFLLQQKPLSINDDNRKCGCRRQIYVRRSMEPRVQKIVELTQSNLERRITVEELADSVNLSPSRLRYLFKTQTGVSLARYLRLQRMDRAKFLLETTFLTVKEIMLKCGFSDESHFVRAFEMVCGLAPAKYREAFLKEKSQTGMLTYVAAPFATRFSSQSN